MPKDVRLPNGTVIKGVPDDATKDQIMAKAIAAGLAKKEDFEPSVSQRPAEYPLGQPAPAQKAPEVPPVENPTAPTVPFAQARPLGSASPSQDGQPASPLAGPQQPPSSESPEGPRDPRIGSRGRVGQFMPTQRGGAGKVFSGTKPLPSEEVDRLTEIVNSPTYARDFTPGVRAMVNEAKEKLAKNNDVLERPFAHDPEHPDYAAYHSFQAQYDLDYGDLTEEQVAQKRKGVEQNRSTLEQRVASIQQESEILRQREEDLVRMSTQGLQDTPEYQLAVEEYNRTLSGLQQQIPAIQDAENAYNKEAMMLARREMEIKRGKGSWGGALWNSAMKGVASMEGASMDLISDLGKEFDKAAGIELSDAAYAAAKKQMAEEIKSGWEGVESSGTTNEFIDELKEKHPILAPGVIGLAESVPAMMTPMMSGIFFQMYGSTKEQMQGEQFADVPEWEKNGVAALNGAIGMVLERIGFRNLVNNTSFIGTVLSNVSKKIPVNATPGDIQRILDAETTSAAKNFTLRLVGGGLAEAETGATQEALDIALKEAYNAMKDKQLFDNPKTWKDFAGQVALAGVHEMIGGKIMAIPGALSQAMGTRGAVKKIEDRQFEYLEQTIKDKDFRATWEAKSLEDIKQGRLTEAEFEKQKDDLDVAESIVQQIPDNMPVDKRREAFDILLEKEGLKNRNKILSAGQLQAIDAKLAELAGQKPKETEVKKNPTVKEDAEQAAGPAPVLEDDPDVRPVLEQVRAGEFINDQKLKAAEDRLYDIADDIEKRADLSPEQKAQMMEVVENNIQKLQDHGFRTRTETRTTTQTVAAPSPRPTTGKESRGAQPIATAATDGIAVTLDDGVSGPKPGVIKKENGQYVFHQRPSGAVKKFKPVVLGDAAVVDGSVQFSGVENPAKGPVTTVAKITLPDGKTLSILDDDLSIDAALHVKRQELGPTPQEEFDISFNEVVQENEVEVPYLYEPQRIPKRNDAARGMMPSAEGSTGTGDAKIDAQKFTDAAKAAGAFSASGASVKDFINSVLPKEVRDRYSALYELVSKSGLRVVMANGLMARTGSGFAYSGAFVSIDPTASRLVSGMDDMVEGLNHELIHALVQMSDQRKLAKMHKDLQEVFDLIIKNKDGASPKVQQIIDYIESTSKQFEMDVFDEESNLVGVQGDFEEILTHAFTNPDFAEFLSGIQWSGETGKGPKTLWDKLKELVLEFVKQVGLDSSALDRVTDIVNEHFSEGAFLTRFPAAEKDQAFGGIEEPKTPIGDTKTVVVDGVERTALNSEGKPIHPTIEGVRNFWRWFGESKVVDDQGRPLVVHHGTPDKGFEQFDLSKSGTRDPGWIGRGIYLTTDGAAAIGYANTGRGENRGVYELYASIKNPFMWGEKDYGAYGLVMTGAPLPSFLQQAVYEKTGYRHDPNEKMSTAQMNRTIDSISRAIREVLIERGYDGVITTYGDGGYEMMAIAGNQIKSATGNYGTFNPKDARIRYMKPDDDGKSTKPTTVAELKAKYRLDQKLSKEQEKERMRQLASDFHEYIAQKDARTKAEKEALKEKYAEQFGKYKDEVKAILKEQNAQLKQVGRNLRNAIVSAATAVGQGMQAARAASAAGIAQGKKQAAIEQDQIMQAVRNEIEELKLAGSLTTAQARLLVDAASKVNFSSIKSLEKFYETVDKVTEDVAFAAKASEAKKLQKKAKQRSHPAMNTRVARFTAANPKKMTPEDLNDYIQALKELSRSTPRYFDMEVMYNTVLGYETKKKPKSPDKVRKKLTDLSDKLSTASPTNAEGLKEVISDTNSLIRNADSALRDGIIDQVEYDILMDGIATTQDELTKKYAKEIKSITEDLVLDIEILRQAGKIDTSNMGKYHVELVKRFEDLTEAQLLKMSPFDLAMLYDVADAAMADGIVNVAMMSAAIARAEASRNADAVADQINSAKTPKANFREKKDGQLSTASSSFWEAVLGLGSTKFGPVFRYLISPTKRASSESNKFISEAGDAYLKIKDKWGLGKGAAMLFRKSAGDKDTMNRLGVVVTYLQEYANNPQGSQGDLGRRDWFDNMDTRAADWKDAKEAAAIKRVWDAMPKTNGKVDPKDVYESFVNGDPKYLSKEELGFLKEVMEWKEKNITPMQQYANELRGKPMELVMFHMPRLRINSATETKGAPEHFEQRGPNLSIRASTGMERESNKITPVRTNFERLFFYNAEQTAVDYYFTPVLQQVNHVMNTAAKKVDPSKNQYLAAAAKLLNDSMNREFAKSNVMPIVRNALKAKSIQILFRPIRVLQELVTAQVSYPLRTGAPFSVWKNQAKRIGQLITGRKSELGMVMDIMRGVKSSLADKENFRRVFEFRDGQYAKKGFFEKYAFAGASLPETAFAATAWEAVFMREFQSVAGKPFDKRAYRDNREAYVRQNRAAMEEAGSVADGIYEKISGPTTQFGSRKAVKIPLLNKYLQTNTTFGASVSWMSNFPARSWMQLTTSLESLARLQREATLTSHSKGEVAYDAVAQSIGVVAESLVYTALGAVRMMYTPVGAAAAVYLAKQVTGDDDDEEERARVAYEKALREANEQFAESLSVQSSLIGSTVAMTSLWSSQYGSLGRDMYYIVGSAAYTLAHNEAMGFDKSDKKLIANLLEQYTYRRPTLVKGKYGTEEFLEDVVAKSLPFVGIYANELKNATEAAGGAEYLFDKAASGEIMTDSEKEVIALTWLAMTTYNTLGMIMSGQQLPFANDFHKVFKKEIEAAINEAELRNMGPLMQTTGRGAQDFRTWEMR